MRGIAVLIASVALYGLLAPASAQQPQTFTLLDRYAAGAFDNAIARALTEGDRRPLSEFRRQFQHDAPLWVHAGGSSEEEHRLLVAADFVVEFAHAVYDSLKARHLTLGYNARDSGLWISDLRPLIEDACSRLRRTSAHDDAQRDWFRASLQVFNDFDDNDVFPHADHGVVQEYDRTPGHLGHALVLFPEDPWFLVLSAERHTKDLASLALATGRASSLDDRLLVADFRQAEKGLERLQDVSSVRAEVNLYLGTVAMALGDLAKARVLFDNVAPWTSDPCRTYLSQFLRARVDDHEGLVVVAESEYRAALAIEPRAQSASISLAVLLTLDGNRAESEALVRAALIEPIAEDPFPDFVSSHNCSMWPTFAQAMRRYVH